jgi:GNAT superfamily N-acetyltransferase
MATVAGSVRAREWAYVPFSDRLAESAPRARWSSAAWSVLIGEQRAGGQRPALLVTRSGLLLPALGGDLPLPRTLRPLVYGACGRLHSAMGLRTEVARVQELLGRGYAVVDYLLMTVDAAAWRPAAVPPGLVLQRGRTRDAKRLFDLQRAYEVEEVLLDGSRFNPDECLRLLRRGLQRELVYFATIRGHPVAKAATNARGFAVDQIGGVFTEQRLRGRGYGAAVMTILLRTLFAAGKSATLFVKPDNKAAIRLYENLGFATRDEYRICYYRG